MSIFDEPKIDCHNHVFDPGRFEFSPKAHYFPVGAELGARGQGPDSNGAGRPVEAGMAHPEPPVRVRGTAATATDGTFIIVIWPGGP